MTVQRLLLLTLCGACAVGGVAAAAPRPAAPELAGVQFGALNRAAAGTETETSTNWSGYAVTHRRPFTSVTGRWIQPAATCGTESTFAAFWVGLGGLEQSSYAVEQTGTLANCSGGTAYYRTWYELYPKPPVYLRLAVRPGDMMSATVSVKGTTVLIRLKNVTTGSLFTKKLRMSRPDLGSAEWVAEAPAGCDLFGNCAILPLTNFGTLSFSRASARIKGHVGRISDPSWTATAIQLRGDLDNPEQAGASATPGALGADGGSFAITWEHPAPTPPAPASG